jgi:hypothetical protein
LRGLTHGMAYFQADIPQRREALLQRAQTRCIGAFDQRKQIDVRIGKQQAAAEATNGKQCCIGHFAKARRPHMRNDARNRIAAPAR